MEEYLRRHAEADDMECSVVYTARHTNAFALQHIAEEFEATDMIACGGDGTVNLVASAVRNTNLNLGIVPVGSGNGLSRTVGIPMNVHDAYAVVRRGKVEKIDSFCVNRQFACMLAGVGLDAAVAESFANNGNRGFLTYTYETLVQYFKAEPYHFEIEIDGCAISTEAWFISIANSNQFGNNFTIAPLASLSDGLLDIVIVQKMSKAALPLALWQQVRGQNTLQTLQELKGHKILYSQGKTIRIKNTGNAPLHIDGDPAAASAEIQFSINPHSIRMLVP